MVALSLVQMAMVLPTNTEKERDFFSTSFCPSLCVTHRCNLSCVYCYQNNKSNARMTIDTAKKCIDDIFRSIPEKTEIIEISFIGGEPLLEMDLIKAVYDYTIGKYPDSRLRFFATTNGTMLSDDDKEWFKARKNKFVLGLSLDGTPNTHNVNRSNSFDRIDIPFFVETWPKQGPKMTISKYTIDKIEIQDMNLED
ncbi:MAG: radical SAM protein, partial [Oscillospiraceae bacterium]